MCDCKGSSQIKSEIQFLYGLVDKLEGRIERIEKKLGLEPFECEEEEEKE